MPRRARKAVAPRPAGTAEAKPGPKAPPADARPPRPSKAQVQAEKYPNADRFPALRRALHILHQMQAGKSREEAEALADAKVGPRAPRSIGKPKRGKRPEPEKRVRVKAARRRA